MNKTKLFYWIPTVFIFLFEGVMPALFSTSDMAKEGVTHLGYPIYFLYMLTVYKVLGAIALVVPQVPRKFKEAAYVGFFFNFVSAGVSHFVVDGPMAAIFPLFMIGVLGLSYKFFTKLWDECDESCNVK
jgi:hypothetical protein